MTILQNLTEAAIEKETSELAALGGGQGNLINVFRDNFDLWNDRLFPILRSRKKGCYEYVAELLNKAGYGEVSSTHVGAYMSRVRKERQGRRGR